MRKKTREQKLLQKKETRKLKLMNIYSCFYVI